MELSNDALKLKPLKLFISLPSLFVSGPTQSNRQRIYTPYR